MRLSRFISIVILITSLALLYVYQQTEIFRLAYIGQKKQANLEDLVEKNSLLSYNIRKDSSLVNITHKILRPADFQMPDSYRMIRIGSVQEALKAKNNSAGKETLISRIFGIKRRAEAKTLSP